MPSARPSAAALPMASVRPSTRPVTPRPVGESKSSTGGSGGRAWPRGPPPRPADARLAVPARRRGAAVRLVQAVGGATATTAAAPRSACRSCRPPACRCFSIRSSASAFLISTPTCAPRPTPTMIDIGVARPSAQGQAMISTATAATSPWPARLRPPDRPGAKASIATAITPARTSPPPGRPGAGSARGSAAPRRPCGRSAPAPCRARPIGAHHEGALPVQRAADDRQRRPPWPPASIRR
jgi:hypothetical protein